MIYDVNSTGTREHIQGTREHIQGTREHIQFETCQSVYISLV